ncbi:MAG: nitroreductase family protein [bacterium]
MSVTEKTQSIRNRRSIRSYKPDLIPDEIIRDIVDCARLAPTARNVQPWVIGVIRDKKLRDSIADLAEYGKFISKSPVCFAVFIKENEKYFMEDGCAATMNIILAAAAHGVGTCWVAGHKKDYVGAIRELLGVPSDYTLISLISAGYALETPNPSKKSVDDVVFFDLYE